MQNAGSCYRYHKGTDFQANHNMEGFYKYFICVVIDTTKVQIFKQITTYAVRWIVNFRCYRYHKGTDFQANHNQMLLLLLMILVVIDTTKVQIFKQITTIMLASVFIRLLL